MDDYKCSACGYVYSHQADGDAPGLPATSFDELPDDYVCPVCGFAKEMFERVNKTIAGKRKS